MLSLFTIKLMYVYHVYQETIHKIDHKTISDNNQTPSNSRLIEILNLPQSLLGK